LATSAQLPSRERCKEELERKDELDRMGGRMPFSIPLRLTWLTTQQQSSFFRLGCPPEGTFVWEHAQTAWSLLSPDDEDARIKHITPSFYKYFYHILNALQCGKAIPRQVPVQIRATLSRSTTSP
jgi:hypothetical protein